ncbi:MAG TPA: carboxypeptidase regulatory-like domain-containing protein [Terriglobia bacterium]|nr:carboxypeptidase regulatory-like domain-containing protein [Terriglobia bacterium]
MEHPCTRGWGKAVFSGLAILLALGLLAIPRLTIAQEVTGGITGTVTDPSGAVVPNASVTATDMHRGTTWPTQTNAAGVYNLPRLPIGEYEVKVSASGFQTTVHPAFELQMNQIARVDLQLTVGSKTQTVSVTSAPPLLQTDTIQVGLVTSSNFNVNLPLATRNFIQLTLITPGATTVNPASFENGQRTGGGGRPYINGNREEANNFLLDGIDNNQISDNLTSYQPSVDAIQEFNVITNNAPAQYGQFQGGIISTTIKSGTNQYHGDAFEFVRNDVFNANSWANNWNLINGKATPRAPQRWNEFGGVFGGPIKKDKLFFFADYQGERFDNPPATGFISVLTAAERGGDFSDKLNPPAGSGVKGVQIYNPCSSFSAPCTVPAAGNRQLFPNNVIPASMIDPAIGNLFASGLYPAPVNGNLQNNALNSSASHTNSDQGDIKIDYTASEKDHIFGRYSQGMQDIPGTNSVVLLGDTFNLSPFHGAVIDWTHSVSPTVVSDARIGVNRILLHNGANVPGVGNLADKLGIANGNVHGPGLLGLNFPTSFIRNMGQANSEQLFADTTIEPMEDLIITHGRHTIRTGFEYMRHAINTYYAGNNGKYGFLAFNGQYTSGPVPGAGVGLPGADFVLGLPYDVGLGLSSGTWGQRSNVFGPYIQDDWRATDKLTLNLGVRWEYNSTWSEVFSRQANFSPIAGVEQFQSGANMGICPEELGAANCVVTNSGGVYNPYWRDWEPRIGFAYNFGKSTVLRGAYTISSFLEGTGTNLRLPLNPPFQAEFENVYTTGSFLTFPGSTVDQGLSVLTSPKNPYTGATIRLWDPNVQPDQVSQWNLSIEHQFAGDTLLSVAYVGQHGTHLMVPMPYLQKQLLGTTTDPVTGAVTPVVAPSPFLSGDQALTSVISQISGTASNGDQAYDALQVSVTKHLSHGLEYQISYAYSKAMTNAIGYYGQGGGQAASNSAYWQNLYNGKSEWGPTYFDATHLFTASYVYQLPFGTGRRFGNHMNPVVNAVVGGWQASGIISLHSGYPITITANDASGTKSRGAKANCIAGITYGHDVGIGTTWFNTSSFSQPATGTFGSCANGTVRGPGLRDWDLGLQKDFHISESKRIELRGEFLNFTNTPLYLAPNRSVTSGTFGEISAAQGQRNIQLALKFYF